MRHDPAIRSLALFLPLAIGMINFVLGLAFWRAAAQQREVSLDPLLAILWLGTSFYLVLGRVRTRSNRFEVTVPIPARRLWLRHVGAVLLAGTIITAASFALVAALWQSDALARFTGVGGSLLRLGALLAGALMLAVAALETIDPTQREIPPSGRQALRSLAVSLGVLALLLMLARLPAGFALLLPVAALALGARTYDRIPAAFTLVPASAAVPGRSSLGSPAIGLDGSSVGRARTLRLVSTIVEQIPRLGRATPLLTYPWIFLLGMLISGALTRRWEAIELQYIYLPLVPYFLLALVGPRSNQLRHLDPLPIARRLILALLVLPNVLVFSLGYGAGIVTLERFPSQREMVGYQVRPPYSWTTVPYRHLEISWSGDIPTVEAPWGEAHEAWSIRPLHGMRFAVYSPFTAAEATSVEFEGWTVARAAATVYDAALPHNTVIERYFEVEEDRITGLTGDGLTLRQDFPNLRPVDRDGPFFPLLLLMTFLPGFLMLAIFFRTLRLEVSERLRQTVFWGLLIVAFAALLAEIALAVAGLLDPEYLAAAFEILVCDLGWSAGGTAAAWGISLVLLAAGYRVAERQFQRIELSTTPSKFTLLERF